MKVERTILNLGLPAWLMALDPEDWSLVRHFIVHSGSLKELAKIYGVSYPTIRQRLNRLIDKIHLSETQGMQGLPALIKELTLQEAIAPAVARSLIAAYQKEKSEQSEGRVKG